MKEKKKANVYITEVFKEDERGNIFEVIIAKSSPNWQAALILRFKNPSEHRTR
jgi:hypothetical protein